MNTLFLANANGGNNGLWGIIIFVVLIALMYFTMIKPQKKQQQKKMEMMNELKKGDNVIMIDGLHGKIDSVNSKDKTVVIDADGIYLTFSRMAVQQIVSATPAPAESPAPEKEDKAEEAPKTDSAAESETQSPADKKVEDKPNNSSTDSEKK